MPGQCVEVIHPDHPHLIVPAKITKSLGPYYFLVTTDPLENVPSKMFYGYADCPDIYTPGWCEARGLELVLSKGEHSSRSNQEFIGSSLTRFVTIRYVCNLKLCVKFIKPMSITVNFLYF